jgi:hypothetical protein
MYRYALYFAPAPGSEWDIAGSRWLGRSAAARGQALPQPEIPGVQAEQFAALTKEPRRYGWHGTLRAPFALVPGVTPDALREAVRALCRGLEPFTMPRLGARRLGNFLALVPGGEAGPCAPVDRVAEHLVRGLDGMAAPLPPAELERRRAAGLTPEEDALLLRWGYPFVLNRFRFHLSLTGALRGADAATVDAIEKAALAMFGPLPDCPFDAVALFAEPERGADFVLVERLELGV